MKTKKVLMISMLVIVIALLLSIFLDNYVGRIFSIHN